MKTEGLGFPDNLMSIFGFERTGMIPKNKPWRSKEYRAWVSTLPCVACKKQGPNEPHHLRFHGNAGTGMKPSDSYCIPLCNEHHIPGIHRVGNQSFEKEHNLDLVWQLVQVLRGRVEKDA